MASEMLYAKRIFPIVGSLFWDGDCTNVDMSTGLQGEEEDEE